MNKSLKKKKIVIEALPDNIFKRLTLKNWEQVFDDYMTANDQYVWDFSVTKEFIKTLIDQTLNEVEKKVRNIPALTDAQTVQIQRVLKVIKEVKNER